MWSKSKLDKIRKQLDLVRPRAEFSIIYINTQEGLFMVDLSKDPQQEAVKTRVMEAPADALVIDEPQMSIEDVICIGTGKHEPIIAMLDYGDMEVCGNNQDEIELLIEN